MTDKPMTIEEIDKALANAEHLATMRGPVTPPSWWQVALSLRTAKAYGEALRPFVRFLEAIGTGDPDDFWIARAFDREDKEKVAAAITVGDLRRAAELEPPAATP